MTPDGVGPLLARRRGGVAARMWGRAGLLVLDLWLSASVARMLLGTRDHFVRDAAVLLLAVVALVLVLVVLLVRRARRRIYEVHQRGLVLRRRGRAGSVVVAWASVDPGRVILSEPPRRVHSWTIGGVARWAVQAPVVLVNGHGRVAKEPEAVTDLHRYDSGVDDSSFGWWQIEVTDPVDLLRAIESAMAADGHHARGLAAAVLSRRYVSGGATRRATEQLDRSPDGALLGLDRR